MAPDFYGFGFCYMMHKYLEYEESTFLIVLLIR